MFRAAALLFLVLLASTASSTTELGDDSALSDEDLLALIAEDCFDGDCGEDGLAALSLAQLRATVMRESAVSGSQKKVEIFGEEADFEGALAMEEDEGLALFQTSAKVLHGSSKSDHVISSVGADGSITTDIQPPSLSGHSGPRFITVSADGSTSWADL
eukprot:TRINITY_DN49887_c0_g1_i1.p1 TRINITY_DN49887_c0_g1~~TRINITY_DN49887_c0_g1_i1.p1  ORF type:complete len:159 (-),score=42.93 TRINITY_DN49887_c0_g1_i1:68-544(-)